MNRWKRKVAWAVLGALGLTLASCVSPAPEESHSSPDIAASSESSSSSQDHEHAFDRQVATEEYLAAPADCDTPASYYYSCECGEKGTETFERGDPLGHDFSASVATEEHLCSPADYHDRATFFFARRRCGLNDPQGTYK